MCKALWFRSVPDDDVDDVVVAAVGRVVAVVNVIAIGQKCHYVNVTVAVLPFPVLHFDPELSSIDKLVVAVVVAVENGEHQRASVIDRPFPVPVNESYLLDSYFLNRKQLLPLLRKAEVVRRLMTRWMLLWLEFCLEIEMLTPDQLCLELMASMRA